MASEEDDYMLQLALAMSMYDQGDQQQPGAQGAELQQQLQAMMNQVMAQQQAPNTNQATPNPHPSSPAQGAASALGGLPVPPSASGVTAPSALYAPAGGLSTAAPATAGSASSAGPAGPAGLAFQPAMPTAAAAAGPGGNNSATLLQLQAALAMALQGSQAPGVGPAGLNGLQDPVEEGSESDDPMDVDMDALVQSMLQTPSTTPSHQATAEAVALAPAPSWLSQLEQWLPAATPAPPHTEVSFSSEELTSVLTELGKWMNTTVATTPGNNSTLLMVSSSGAGQSSITTKEIQQLVNRRLQQLRSSGAPQAQLLCSWFLAARQTAGAPAVVGLSQSLQWAAAHKALSLLLEDEEGDLFYESGLFTTQFMNAVSAGQISPDFLAAMLAVSDSSKLASKAWTNVMKLGFDQVKRFKFTDPAELNGLLFPLDILLRTTALQQGMAARLATEAKSLMSGWTSRHVRESSLLSPLLSPSPMVDPLKVLSRGVDSPAKDVFLTLRGYPNVPGDIEMAKNSIRISLDKLQDAAHQLCKRVATIKTSPPNMGREALMSWLAGVARVNEFRLKAGDRGMLRPEMLTGDMQDGLLVNLTAVCLRFCRPFMQGYLAGDAKFADLFVKHLSASYYPSNMHRLVSYPHVTTLAGSKPSLDNKPTALPVFHPKTADKTYPSFIADIFFMTQRMIHVVMLPAIHMFEQLVQTLTRKMTEDGEGGAHDKANQAQLMLLYDCNLSQLLAPSLAGDAAQFAVLQLVWLHQLVIKGDVDAFKLIPQYVAKDACGLLIFVIRSRGAEHLSHTPIGLLLQSLVSLLERPDLVRSPLVHSKMVELVLVMLSPQIDVQRRTVGGSLGRTYMLPAESALVAAVLGSTAAQEQLIPALMRVYVNADYVEGLDVDRDDYDKFSMRHFVDLILEELYKDELCVKCMTQLVEADQKAENGSLFASYIGCVLNDLIYLFKDSLDRLADIHSIEASKADAAAWAALPINDRQDKEKFYSGQQHTATGFLRLAITTLRVLDMLASNPIINQTFLRPPLSSQTSYAINHFLELLVGPRCQQLQVDNPGQYHFDRSKLLISITALCLRLAEHPQFAEVMANDEDYSTDIMTKTRDLLNGLHKYEHVDRLEKLMERVSELQRRKSQSGNGVGNGAAMQTEGDDVDGVQLVDRLAFKVAEPSNLEELYVQELSPITVSTFDATAAGAYNRHFSDMAAEAAGNTAAKMKRLSREFRDFTSRTKLPVHVASSIFVRHDEERWDKVRALITGPEDTPYAFGCFIFDLYFPARYPEIPPLMLLETTGEGRARFNPNLYADGKVCLSLLGTWHGGSESEKWNPSSSNMFQILLSIQGMIFVEDPYFNEPNVELMRGKAEGISASTSYNAQIHLNTIRYAMLDVIKRPRPGFETVIVTHFKLARHRILKQCRQWVQQASVLDKPFQKRLQAAVTELHQVLDAL